MLRKLSDVLRKASTGWVTLVATLIFFLFVALVAPGQAQKAEEVSGEAGTPDLSFFYTPDDLYHMAESYGEQGRQDYVRARFTFDLAFPLVYTFFLVTAISWLFGRAFPPGSRWQYANLAPLAAILLDFGENITTSLVMARYPAQTPIIAALAPVFTATKWVMVGASILLLIIGLAAVIGKGISERTR